MESLVAAYRIWAKSSRKSSTSPASPGPAPKLASMLASTWFLLSTNKISRRLVLAFRAAARMPTERVLAERFRLPRSVVRKALLPLEIEGKVTRHVGRGTFVSHGREERQIVS